MGGPAEEAARRIDTLEDLQYLGPELLKRINADQGLAVAAAANPILALSELGYELAPAVRQDLEERSRFSKRQIVSAGSSATKCAAWRAATSMSASQPTSGACSLTS